MERPKFKFDMTFARGGRALHEWLPELVSEDRNKRLVAAKALGGMSRGLPSYDTDWADLDVTGGIPDIAGQQRRFAEAVREVVERPDFPKALFVRRLMLYRLSLKQDWLRRVKGMSHNDEKYDQRETQLLERALTSDDAEEREQAARRFGRLFCASLARDNRISSESESMQAPGMVSSEVFHALGIALLAADDVLGEMLEGGLEHEALDALARAGPAARAFAPRLLARMDVQERFDAARALGSIAQDQPDIVRELLDRLREEAESVKGKAANALEHAGPRLAGREAEAVRLLMPLTYHPKLLFEVIPAVASVGRDDPAVARRVVELASHRPPRLKVVNQGERWEHTYDEVMYERGVALSAMRYLRRHARLVVPVLADAIETFQEYDPDESYHAEHGRVCRVLETFGRDAAPAVPALVRYLERWLELPPDRREWPQYVFELLTAIGPAASAAEPVLLRLRDTASGEDLQPHLDPDDRLDATILAIRGQSPSA